jgi:hypothetical protein
MAEISYAFVKDNKVKNVLLFDSPSEEFLNLIKDIEAADLYVEVTESTGLCEIDYEYDGTHFRGPKPYNSFVWSEVSDGVYEWRPPFAPPAQADGEQNRFWAWDESTVSWVEIQP